MLGRESRKRRSPLRWWTVLATVAIVCFAPPAFAQGTATAPPAPRVAPTKVAGAATTATAPATAGDDDSGDDSDATQPGDVGDSGDDVGSSGDDTDSGDDTTVAPPAVPDVGPPSDIRPGSYTLEARLAPQAPALGEGVHWRIFGDAPGTDGHLPLLGEADGGIIYIRLDPGTYYVHAAFGRAGTTRKLDVTSPTGGQVFVLNAGGMRLTAMNGKDQALTPTDVSFDIYAPDEGGSGERFLLVPNAPPDSVVSLNAGTYHVVCKYGDANAIVRADIKVEPGKLTDATIFQKAARLTLKLVEQHGGEAIADTAWTVTTTKGDTIVQSVGAFPSVVLAAGDYIAKAKHDGKLYQENFSVAAGVNHDVEVLAE